MTGYRFRLRPERRWRDIVCSGVPIILLQAGPGYTGSPGTVSPAARQAARQYLCSGPPLTAARLRVASARPPILHDGRRRASECRGDATMMVVAMAITASIHAPGRISSRSADASAMRAAAMPIPSACFPSNPPSCGDRARP